MGLKSNGEDEFEEKLVMTPCVAQFPATERAMLEMAQGKRSVTKDTWRYLLADATVREAEMQVSVVRTEWVEDGEGSRWERPTVGLIAWAAHEAVLVEPLKASGTSGGSADSTES